MCYKPVWAYVARMLETRRQTCHRMLICVSTPHMFRLCCLVGWHSDSRQMFTNGFHMFMSCVKHLYLMCIHMSRDSAPYHGQPARKTNSCFYTSIHLIRTELLTLGVLRWHSQSAKHALFLDTPTDLRILNTRRQSCHRMLRRVSSGWPLYGAVSC